jgi:hypothetical protein
MASFLCSIEFFTIGVTNSGFIRISIQMCYSVKLIHEHKE